MELIEENAKATTLRFTAPEYAILSSILRVFENKMDNDQVDYIMLMATEQEAEKFLTDFWAIFER